MYTAKFAWESGSKTVLLLRNIPRTALNSDIRRMLDRHEIENVKAVHKTYVRFLPEGKAHVAFETPEQADMAAKRLRNATMSGSPVQPMLTHVADVPATRSRGAKGREEAAARGCITGTGPDAGVTDRGRGVVLWGLPGRMTVDELKELLLRGFSLMDGEAAKGNVVLIEPDGRTQSSTSRHYVRLDSIAEAHRLVRQLHMTDFKRRGGRTYRIHARVVI
ncbi:hypothetical protein BU17DRAFT_44846 [Hysterangium stoloniferum]|nr:hypothetical protein BU17DRAFT_44846 [Hysterangium stoloniferum]